MKKAAPASSRSASVRMKACGLRVDLGQVVVRALDVDRRAQRRSAGPRSGSPPSAAATPRSCQSPAMRCSSFTGIASSTSLPTTTPRKRSRQLGHPAHLAGVGLQAFLLPLAQAAREVDDGVARHRRAERLQQLLRQRAGAGAELPDLVRARHLQGLPDLRAPARGRTAASAPVPSRSRCRWPAGCRTCARRWRSSPGRARTAPAP